ncbi:hypothetical protein T265_08465 [Opisthorchis viverrini]|uniref:Uncharacterized protein n=1 Tax=Opisthorchis viverrini TaxID=6198 RepID=A0A074ZK29_OPIVI|nr:hypothetical protein T265_08465 [Opisthorchis viverrini]KER23700.1 hypothetical protein T265_08465 [Opisthorchis viverrini]
MTFEISQYIFIKETTHKGFDKYTQLQINLVFTRDWNEFLVYASLQLDGLHKVRLMFQLVRYSR